MDGSLTVLDKRNRLFVKLIWGLLALGVLADYGAGLPSSMIWMLVIIGSLTCGFATLLTYMRIFRSFIMYLVASILTLIIVLLIVLDPNPIVSTYFMVYVNIGLMTLYANYKPIIFSGVLGMGVSTYLYLTPEYKEKLFPGESLIYLYLYLILFTVSLVFSMRFSERLQRQVVEEGKVAAEANRESALLLEKMKDTVMTLNDFSSRYSGEVAAAGQISREVTAAFGEMSAASEHQTSAMQRVSASIDSVESAVGNLAGKTSSLAELSEETTELARSGSEGMSQLMGSMNQVERIMAGLVELMEDMERQNAKVGDINRSISDIASQTQLLSLNASIEAAHAGEQGRGFAVVADAVGKLADSSSIAAGDIAEILESIRQRMEAVGAAVAEGQQAVRASSGLTEEVGHSVGRIKSNSDKVLEHAGASVQASAQLEQDYHQIAGDTASMASLTEQNQASMEEINASMAEQHSQIVGISSGYEKLNELVAELRYLVQQRSTGK
ncbi:methyl-accepting chemotaxis protein [Paenibacillaceae bacterium GAS479]|nr:methyl-accepting chemotaxis protein [Paenibacillaceae bacterium GAS479]